MKEIIYVQCSAYCLAHIKETINVSYFIVGTQYTYDEGLNYYCIAELENYTLDNFNMFFKSYFYISLSKLERLK